MRISYHFFFLYVRKMVGKSFSWGIYYYFIDNEKLSLWIDTSIGNKLDK